MDKIALAEARKRQRAIKVFSSRGRRYTIALKDLEPFLKDPRNPNVNPAKFGILQVHSAKGTGWGDKPWETFYFDTQLAFVLEYGRTPVAILGFRVAENCAVTNSRGETVDFAPDEAITLEQLQGPHVTNVNSVAAKEDIEKVQKAAQKCLPAIRWERFLLKLFCDWAFSNGFTSATT